MKIKLVQLKIRNFKGQRNITIDFDPLETFIYGKNTAGKTTIFDAYSYLLFGKDSQDNKTFSVQTLSEDGLRIDHLETEVSGVIIADGRKIELKRVYKQKWTKKRGSETAEYVGNEEDLFINEVPCKLSEYKQKVDTLIQESIFKLITNVGYFNSLNWKDRRQYLMDMANINDEDVARGNKDMESLIFKLASQDKSIEDYKREVAAKKRKIKEELQNIAPRIDEADQAKPQVKDWAKIEKQIKEKSAKIEEIEDAIGSQIDAQRELNKKILAHDNKLLEAKRDLQKIESRLRSEYDQPDDRQNKIDQANREISSFKRERLEIEGSIARYEKAVTGFKTEIEDLQAQKSELSSKWKEENARTFKIDPDQCKCPTCQREFEAGTLEAKKESLEANFNKDKASNLEAMNSKGKKMKEQIGTLQERIENGNKSIAEMKDSLSDIDQKMSDLNASISSLKADQNEKPSFESIRDSDKEYIEQKAQIEALQAQTPDRDESLDTIRKQKQAEKATIQEEIDQLRLSLNDKQRIEQLTKRIAELTEQESSLAQELAMFEKEEFAMLEFTKAKVVKIEEAINSKFKVVRFKMFNQLINGGEEECCEITVNGVPYQDVNQAGKVKASLDVINALCDHYEVYAPIFIDGRESVTELIPVKSQLVNLIVSSSDEFLRVA